MKTIFPKWICLSSSSSCGCSCLVCVGWGTLLFANAYIVPWNSFQVITATRDPVHELALYHDKEEVNPIQHTHIQNRLHSPSALFIPSLMRLGRLRVCMRCLSFLPVRDRVGIHFKKDVLTLQGIIGSSVLHLRLMNTHRALYYHN